MNINLSRSSDEYAENDLMLAGNLLCLQGATFKRFSIYLYLNGVNAYIRSKYSVL